MIKKTIKQIRSRFYWGSLPPGVYCFNYHRIGDPDQTDYDPNVFSCNADALDQHIGFFKEQFELVDLDELVGLSKSGKTIDRRYALITFDDGYLDNYELALPVLERHAAPATFFVVHEFVEKESLAWWDEIAWLVKQSSLDEVQARGWQDPVKIDRNDYAGSIRRVLAEFKQDESQSIEQRLSELRVLFGALNPPSASQSSLFMGWEELGDLAARGMSIGSHGMTHRILAQLSDEDQWFEVSRSRLELSEALGCTVSAIAYPVGSEQSSDSVTEQAVLKAGYELGFSFVKGYNPSLTQPANLRLRRISIDGNPGVADLKQLIVSAVVD